MLTVAPPRTDRKPLSCNRDNFEILAIRDMFALMNSWDKSPGDSLTIEDHPLRGVTYALTHEPPHRLIMRKSRLARRSWTLGEKHRIVAES